MSLNKQSNFKYVWSKIKSICNNYNRRENSNQYNPDSVNIILQKNDELCLSWITSFKPNLNSSINETLNQEFSWSEFIIALSNQTGF